MRILPIFLALGGSVFAQDKVAPVPADPHELVTGMAQVMSTPADRVNAMALLERARQNSDMHMPGAAPFDLKMALNVIGGGARTGMGEVAETWFSGRSWRYEQTLGSYSEVRISGGGGRTFMKRTEIAPIPVQMVRAALFWPVGGNPSTSMIRSAAAQWNGKPVTAILVSGNTDSIYPGRHWVETEYVVDNATGLLQIYSRAPGTFALYSYDKGLQFHGRLMADRITFFVAGLQVVDAQLMSIQDPANVDPNLLSATPEMRLIAMGGGNQRFPLVIHDPTNSGVMKQVIVHALIDGNGNVVDSVFSAAADPALIDTALDLVRKTKFAVGTQQVDAYINVRFVP
jgi:hypothetical protein